ncbi:MAG: SMP-30/gluconolactonase/LRE family protein [Bacteroidota bacterium]
MNRLRLLSVVFCFSIVITGLFGQESRELVIDNPDVVVDLRTKYGVNLLKTEWKYSDVKILNDTFGAPGPSEKDPLALYPTGEPRATWNIEPKAGGSDFDDSSWETLSPTSLEERRCPGRLCFNWYRLNLTIPQSIDGFDPTGSTVFFEVVIDDYSEIWVDGKLDKTFGQSGNGIVKGFNARNRVILTHNAKPGETHQVAILGINGPLADIPDNYIWIRSATVDFHKEYEVDKDWKGLGKVVMSQPQLSQVIDPNEKIEKLAEGFQFIEGPVWHPDGYLLFSDPNANVIYKYGPKTKNVEIYITKSGYSGTDIGKIHQPGSNGLTLDKDGQLYVAQHGNRRVIKHERKGPITVIADSYNGKRLNSPNDLVFKSDGSLYFTDPPYGLEKAYEDPKKETPHQGVYRVYKGKVELMTDKLGGPNGIAFSPNEEYLYVSNWDIRDVMNSKKLYRFRVRADGSLENPELFYEMDQTDEAEALDGVKVDLKGNVFVSAPGGIWILSPNGKLLGKIIGPERPANIAWGDDGKSLYLAAHTGLYKIRTKIGGKMPGINN